MTKKKTVKDGDKVYEAVTIPDEELEELQPVEDLDQKKKDKFIEEFKNLSDEDKQLLIKFFSETTSDSRDLSEEFNSETMFTDTRSSLEDIIAKNIKMSEYSKGKMTKVMTEKDFFSDVSDEHVLGIAGLLMLNETLKSPEIKTFVVNWIIARKSRKGGRSRKDIVEMFKSLNEEIQGLKSKFMDRFGGMFQ